MAATTPGSAAPRPAAPDARAGGLERDVAFGEAAPTPTPTSTRPVHAKYDRYGPAVVGTVVGEHAAPVTIRLFGAGY
jgi:hypothetical protein